LLPPPLPSLPQPPLLPPPPPPPTRKRSAGEEQWFLSKQTRKAAKLRLEESSSVVHRLAVERHAVVHRLDLQHAAAQTARNDAKRRLTRNVAAMRSLSQVSFDAEEYICVSGEE